jgi:dTDP-4-amino-4,6-dideoxygalactose transaminase
MQKNETFLKEVPYIDFTREYKSLEEEFDLAYKRVMNRGHFILGPEVLEFEKAFASYCKTKFAVGVGSGLDALILVLDAWGIGPGDEVILSANTYIATAFAITKLGAKPVVADIDKDTFNIDVSKIEALINPRTKVILPTHLYGQMADMEKICELAKKYNLKVLEDAAQSHGALQNNQICGSHGDATAFSFYPTKNLGAFGDGGAITTNCPILYDKLLHLRNNGSKTKFYYDYIGYNSRLDELQAAFLKIKLKHLDKWNQERQRLSEIYSHELQATQGLVLPTVSPKNQSVWHVYCIRVLNGLRSELVDYLHKSGIGTNVHYPQPLHLQNCYQDLGYKSGDFPLTEQFAGEILSLPLSWYHSEDEIYRVTQTVKEFFHAAK